MSAQLAAQRCDAEVRPLTWLAEDPRPLDWNGPADRPFAGMGADDLDRSIIHRFERVARLFPDHVAVSDGAASLTYGQLWCGVGGLAERIAAATQPGSLVAVLAAANVLSAVAMLACLAAGRPFVALDPTLPAEWREQVLADAKPALILRPDAVPDPAAPDWQP